MSVPQITIQKHSNGIMLLADKAVIEWLQDQSAQGRDDDVGLLQALMEGYACNGGYTPFGAGNANPFVGLTDAPCIAESMATSHDGKSHVIGDLYWFPQYEARDPIMELMTGGKVFFPRAGMPQLTVYYIDAASDDEEDRSLIVCDASEPEAVALWRAHYDLETDVFPKRVGTLDGVTAKTKGVITWEAIFR